MSNQPVGNRKEDYTKENYKEWYEGRKGYQSSFYKKYNSDPLNKANRTIKRLKKQIKELKLLKCKSDSCTCGNS